MAEEINERCSPMKVTFDLVKGDLVRWVCYDMVKVCLVDSTGPNYVALKELNSKNPPFRVYEKEILDLTKL